MTMDPKKVVELADVCLATVISGVGDNDFAKVSAVLLYSLQTWSGVKKVTPQRYAYMVSRSVSEYEKLFAAMHKADNG